MCVVSLFPLKVVYLICMFSVPTWHEVVCGLLAYD